MNTPHTHTPAPAPFTAADNQRLTLYYTCHRDLLALAAATATALVELVAWINLPHIAAAIACIDRHRALGRADKAAEGMMAALDQPPHPTETRRNANLLLRIIRPPAPRTPRPARATQGADADAGPTPARENEPRFQDSEPSSAGAARPALSSPPPRAGASAPPSSGPSAPAPPPGSSR